MDLSSEDSSDENLRAEQEAALYSLVHYTSVEAENNASSVHTTPSQFVTTLSIHDRAESKITNIPSKPALLGGNNMKFSRFFKNIPEFPDLLKGKKKKTSCGIQSAEKSTETNQPKSMYFEHLSKQLSNIPAPVKLQDDCVPNFNNLSNQPLSFIKTEIPALVPGSKALEDQVVSSDSKAIKSVILEKKSPASNSLEHRVESSTNASAMPNLSQKTVLDTNPTEIKTFSFDIPNIGLSNPVGNNLFSPFNAQYLESKTSSENVFRLDDSLFSDEKQNYQTKNTIHAPLLLGFMSGQRKPISIQESSASNSTGDKNITNIVAQIITPDAVHKETEIKKTFVFDLSHLSEGSKKNTSPQLNLFMPDKNSLFSSFSAKCVQSIAISSDETQNCHIKSQKPITALSKHAVENIQVKNKPLVASKLPKKMKAKKKLKILQSNVLCNLNLRKPADKVMFIGIKNPDSQCDVIVLDKDVGIKSIDPDVIILDSDSDESVHVVPLPSAPLPVIISVEDSSDDDHIVRVQPAVVVPFETDPDVAENSFDFLDNVIEHCMGDFDGMRKAQANVLSNLISNHSSKESLVDERLFQVDSTVPEREVRVPKKAKEVPYQDDNVSSSTSSASPILENDRSGQVIVNESGSDTGEPKTPHSFKVPKAKVRTKSRQAKNTANLPSVDYPNHSSSDNDRNDDDILVVHSGTKSTITIEEILSGEMNTKRSDLETTGSDPENPRKRKREESKNREVAKKKKRPGRKKRAKAAKILQKFIRSQPQSNLFSYTKIAGEELVSKEKIPPRNPPSWTKEMKKFYNSSWGGEDHNWEKIRSSMSGNPYIWNVSNEDRYPGSCNRGRPARCRQCQRTGHFAWACPEARTGSKCQMCGQSGHTLKHCPNSICLKCGQPSREFVKWCWQCKGSLFGECTECVWQHNPAYPCRNYRNRPAGMLASANAGYKGYRQRYGSNQPADRGLSPYYNKNFSRRPFR